MRNKYNHSMSFEDAMKYMSKVNVYGSVLGLDNTRELLRRLGNPQDELKFIHVAGTNGKGSVCAYIGTILAEAGYLVGRYISPTILEYRERIQLRKNHTTTYISEEEVGMFVGRIKEVIDGMVEEGLPHPTPFEIETAMSFLYYTDKQCDIVVLEVGMGGRLDSTNVITTTICSVLTSISMDHMQILGDTLEKITYEKAGIVKKNIPVISYEQDIKAMNVIREECSRNQSELTYMSMDSIKNVEHSFYGIIFDYKNYKELKLNLLGENQVKNAALAIEVIHVLVNLGYHIKEADVRLGLLLTRWPGRFEMLCKEPYLFVDGAHNEDAARSLRKSIEIYFTNKRIIYIIGVLADKDYHSVLRHTAKYADTIITITPDNPRALSSKELAKVAKTYCTKVIDGELTENAIDIAIELADKEDIILAFGSLSFLGEIYKHVESKERA